MSHVVRRPGPTEPRGRGGCVPGRPCGGCRSPAATGKHLTCDPRTCGQERGAARGLDGGGCAGVPGDIQPQCPQNLAQLLAPHLPAGPCKLDARSVWAGSPPSPAPVLCLGPQPWPRTWRSLGILVSEVRVRHGWWCVRRGHPTGPCCQLPYSPRCLGWARALPRHPVPARKRQLWLCSGQIKQQRPGALPPCCQGHGRVTRREARWQPVRPAEAPSEPRPGLHGCQLWLLGPSASLSLLWDSSPGLSRRCSSRKVVMSLAMASTSLGQVGARKKGGSPQ